MSKLVPPDPVLDIKCSVQSLVEKQSGLVSTDPFEQIAGSILVSISDIVALVEKRVQEEKDTYVRSEISAVRLLENWEPGKLAEACNMTKSILNRCLHQVAFAEGMPSDFIHHAVILDQCVFTYLSTVPPMSPSNISRTLKTGLSDLNAADLLRFKVSVQSLMVAFEEFIHSMKVGT